MSRYWKAFGSSVPPSCPPDPGCACVCCPQASGHPRSRAFRRDRAAGLGASGAAPRGGGPYLQSFWGRGGKACSAAELNGVCAGQREMDSCVVLILLFSTIPLSTAGSVRLVDGGSRCAGRVEVFHNNQWGTVCDDEWDEDDAAVVCRELGCGDAVDALSDAHFGPGSGSILMDNVACSGSESTLKNCSSRGWGVSDCGHNEDAGVICSRHRKSRLTGGPHLCSGRVEVLQEKTWYTVCDADFDQQDAEVVCRELGCGLPVEVKRAAAFGRGEGQVWKQKLQCRGNESDITLCEISSSVRRNCQHDKDVGLICSGARLVNGVDSCSGRVEIQYLSSSLALHEGRVRLSGRMECEGEVEVYFRQDWRRVLLDSWSESEASVICRQLGCGSVFSFSSSSQSSPKQSHMCVTGFSCSGSEAHLGNCSSGQAVNCSSREQLYITCSAIRLVGSGGGCAGRLEVFHSGSWGTVSDDLWGIEDAQVVCRQLQCGVALRTPVPAQFGPGTGPIWLNEVECEGNETSLWNCSFQLCGENECGHKEDVGVMCSGYKEIRLTEGCEGNLEVFYNGTWGNVCVNGMNEETVSLVCQELNCGGSGSDNQAKARVESAPNWLDDLKCRKHESTLWQCPSSPWGQNNCDSRSEVARITCSDHLPLRLSGGNESCSGRLEVYHKAEWGSVCVDLWDIRDAEVVCRQMGCGPVNGGIVFSAGSGPVWLNRVRCRGNEIHLWDCPHSLKNHTDCSHRQHAGVTCTEISVPSTTTTTTTTAATTTTTPTTTTTSPTTTVKSTTAVPPIYPVSLLVLGVVVFLTFVLLVVLLYQNRRLRRVLSKRRRKTLTEAVYEEIDRRYVTNRNDSTGRGSIFSEEYEDVDEDLLSGSALSEAQHSGYEDVGEELLSGESAKEDPAESYDDVITAGQISDGVAEDVAEGYDDVITADQSSAVVAEDMTDIYDDAVTGPNSNIMLMDTPESYDDVISDEQDVGGVKVKLKLCCIPGWRMTLYRLFEVSTERVYLLPNGDLYIDRRPVIIPPGLPHSLVDPPVCLGPFDTVVTGEGDLIFSEEILDLLEAVPGILSLAQEMGHGISTPQEGFVVGVQSKLQTHKLSTAAVLAVSKVKYAAALMNLRAILHLNGKLQEAEANYLRALQLKPDDLITQSNLHKLWNVMHKQGVRGSGGDDVGAESAPQALEQKQFPWLYRVRLVDGGSRCAGRVEVLHDGQWGTVCDDSWDVSDAAVVCRELGCGEAVDALSDAHFGEGLGQTWMDEVDCSGSESTLKNCTSQGWGEHDCGHGEDAGVICSGGVRLSGGSRCSGRLEVFHGGTWYTVCDADFDQQDAEVVCRELDCGYSVEVLGGAAFGRGEGQVWSEELQCRGNESQIHSCPTSPSLKHNCSHDSDVGLVCAGIVRLVDGGSHCAGRVEVHHNGTWGTVCGDNWDMSDARVVCRELGCGEALDALSDAHFGPGSGPIWLNSLGCSGSESTLKSCSSQGWGEHYCSHDKDAGVVCSGVRLVGGSRCSGRVEVLHGETWYTVCDADFDQQDAEVVCRELGCGLSVEVLGGAAFGRGEGQVWSENLQCRGNESQIHSCPTSPSLKHNCSHDSDVGLVCADSVKLVNGGSRCAGRVEVLHRGQWGTVCGYNWDKSDAAVVCGELGCGEAVGAPQYGYFGPGLGPIWMFDVDCKGSESTLKNCKSEGWGKHYCTHGHDAGVICSGHRKPRLTDGFHLCSGRVEIVHGKTWGTVCDADFDQQDAEVVCRQLACGLPVEVLGGAAFGSGEGQVWSEGFQCRGNESQIHSCPTSPSLKHNCSHDSDVGLVCAGHIGFRLVNDLDTCSGRVELQYLSEWGTVCDLSWDMRAASVLCGQLRCGSAVAVVGSDWFGEGSGRIWADVFDCQGNETHLSKCPISSWSRAACSHKQDAGVICNGSSLAFHEGRVRLSGGTECDGEVEVYFKQEWRRVLLDFWSGSVASVVCRQLGCGSVFNFSSSSPSSPEHRHMCVTGYSCSGSEAHLGNCSSSAVQEKPCSSGEQLSLTCSSKFKSAHSSIRLVGSGGDRAGRLEVFHSGSWGTVCDDLWGIEDAQVVCRQLQCGVALSAPVPAQFGPGNGPIWLNEVECEGNETSLWNCRFQLCGEDECGHKDDVGVVCSEYKEFRLTEGCEGNLEVFYNGSWGNVCVNGMSDETASVVCRELNCGSSSSESWGRARVESAPNWLDDVKCRKHDTTLWHCPSSLWGQNNCDNSNEVARITCSDHLPLRLSGRNESCSGKLEVYHNTDWGSVCDDLWDIRDAEVVCRQLGCGPVNGSIVFGAGSGPVWLSRVKCGGNEIHLWDCPHSLKNHTDCSHRQHVGVTCADIPVPSTPAPIITTPTSTTSKTPTTTVGQPAKQSTTPSSAVPSVYPVSLLVLGVLLFLALVFLVVLLYQNRRLKRVLSKRRRKTLTEAVYEEIDRRYVTNRNDSTGRGSIFSEEYEDVDEDLLSGSVLSEAQHSGYEDVDEELLSEDVAEGYDDVITADQSSAVVTEDMTDNYDDAVTGPNSNIMLMDTPESYDDVITDEQDESGMVGRSLAALGEWGFFMDETWYTVSAVMLTWDQAGCQRGMCCVEELRLWGLPVEVQGGSGFWQRGGSRW
ncbi:hypothetical protein NFI96_005373 [Prochilodus magdalenae]|nr:hypothetical protein NFI96_005373 [Prochilodus magdalenae]